MRKRQVNRSLWSSANTSCHNNRLQTGILYAGIYSTCTYTFDMHYRWQRETSALTSKFEKALLDMNTKVTEERRKSKELTSKFKLQTANTERVSVITVQSLLIICPSFFSYTRKYLNRNRSS